MNLGQAFLFFLGVLGAFNGFILSFYLLLKKKNRSLQKVLLGFLLLMLSIRIGISVVLFFFRNQLDKTVLQIGLSTCLFIGPFLLLFVRTSLRNKNSLSQAWKVFLFSLAGLAIIPGAIFPFRTNIDLWNHHVAWYIYIVWFIFVALAVIDYLVISKRERVPEVNYSLITLILAGNVFLFILSFVSLAVWIKWSYVSGSIFFTIAFYLTFFQSFKEKKIAPKSSKDRYKNKKIADEEAALLIAKLQKRIVENELYKNPDIKIGDVANSLKISTHQLSQLLNDNMQKSFTTFINEYRIKEACHKIRSEPHLKIEEIGYDVGYNSKSTFFTAFKKLTGATPMAYRESIDNIRGGSSPVL